MKSLISQLSYLADDRQARRNLGALFKFLSFVLTVISFYSILFHVIMERVEGQSHSWLTGFYWTLTVMSTLGFGDITFHTDAGRLFSILVLLSGIVLLLIMLPFAFIRYFYAPWLEAQIRMQAPRSVAPEVKDHVILCRYDSIAPGLLRRLEFSRIPYFVLEPDPVVAARMAADEISVVSGEIDSSETYRRLRVSAARMVFANAEDTTNTNIALTIREIDSRVPITALAEEEDSIDILELSGATHVLPLKQKLGEHLAARVSTGGSSIHVVGGFKDLKIAEFLIHETPLAGKTLKETRLRELTGANVVAVWQHGRLQPVHADLRLESSTVPVAIGTEEQIGRLDHLLGTTEAPGVPVLVIGAGKVGRATAQALKRRGVQVHVVDKNERLCRTLADEFDRVVAGDAAGRHVLEDAGLEDAGAVALTTNNDGVNIHLTVYCRRLKSDLNIVTRVTHRRNLEAIYRAGADFALSYSSLGREYLISMLLAREPVMVGEGGDFFLVPTPGSVAGKTLAASGIGASTGLIVIAVEDGDRTLTNPAPTTVLPAGSRLLMLGTAEQREAFSSKLE